MIGFLRDEGFDVFLLDWAAPDPADAENTLETYVDHYIPKAMAAATEEAGADELTVIGYCFAGVLTLLLAAGHPELPIRNLIALTTPCDYREMGFMSKMFLRGPARRRRHDRPDRASCPPPRWTRAFSRSSRPTRSSSRSTCSRTCGTTSGSRASWR